MVNQIHNLHIPCLCYVCHVQYSSQHNREQSDQCGPLEALWSREDEGHGILQNAKERDQGELKSSELVLLGMMFKGQLELLDLQNGLGQDDHD